MPNFRPVTMMAASAFALAGSTGASRAAELQIQEIKAFLVFENSGKVSENIIGSKKEFFNTIIGEGDAGGAANNVLIDLVLGGDEATPQSAKATLKIAYSSFGKKLLLNRTYDTFAFGQNKSIHKTVLLENATCAPVQIDAQAGPSKKSATIKFTCGE